MSAAEILEQIRRLSTLERDELVERIEAEFAHDLSVEQIAELNRRAAEALKYPEQGRPAHEVFNDIEQRLRTEAMTFQVIVEAQAQFEWQAAVDWLENREPSVGSRLNLAILKCIESLSTNPERHLSVSKLTRRAKISG